MRTPGGIASVEARIAAIAGRQHGVITVFQLLAAGLSHKQIEHRVRTGRLYRLHKGVYAVGHVGVANEGKALAAVFSCGEGAGLGLLHAASLFGVSRFRLPALIDVVVPKQRHGRDGVRVHHRALRPGDIGVCNRIPVTSPARMFVDLNDTLTPHQLANLIHQSAYKGLFDARATREVISRSRRTANIERALALHEQGSAGTRSYNEDRFLAICLVEPLVNTVLLDEEVDFLWPQRKLVVEIDGPAHGRPPNQRDDARRDAKLRAANLTVIRLSESDLGRLVRQGAAQERPELVALVR